MITVNLWSILLFYGVCQGCLLVALIPFYEKQARAARLFLTALVGVVTLDLMSFLVVATDLFYQWPHLILLFQPLLFLIGPLYYFFIRSLLEKTYRFSPWHLAHLLPFVGSLFFQWPTLSAPAAAKIMIIETSRTLDPVGLPLSFYLYFSAHIVQTLAYIYTAFRLLSARRTSTFEAVAERPLRRLHAFTRVFMLYWGLSLLALTGLTLTEGFVHEIDYVVVLSQSFIIHAAGYLVLRAPVKSERPVPPLASPTPPRQPTPISADEAALAGALTAYMEREKPYLNPTLSLADLARGLDLHRNTVSRLINQQLGQNVSDFVNGYRVREVQQRLVDPAQAHLSILALALDAGFNSKASFNRAFKKHTGKTPSQFLQANRPSVTDA